MEMVCLRIGFQKINIKTIIKGFVILSLKFKRSLVKFTLIDVSDQTTKS